MFSAQKPTFKKEKSAFTLIELMVVMGLIMIVMTLGIPRLVQHNETPLGGSISAVMDACASARSKAILSGKPMKMIVDASNYSVTVGAGAPSQRSCRRVLARGQPLINPLMKNLQRNRSRLLRLARLFRERFMRMWASLFWLSTFCHARMREGLR